MDEEQVNLQTCIEDISNVLKWMYFDYMLNDINPSLDEFMTGCIESFQKTIIQIDSKYFEHVMQKRKEAEKHKISSYPDIIE